MGEKELIQAGRTSLGIEFGSTRIKAVLIDEKANTLATGNFDWENQLSDGIWTYSLDYIWRGLQECFQSLMTDVKQNYGIQLETIGALGFSAMMHGYMAFDHEENLLVPFRTWRNSITSEAARELTELFHYNIPERWSIAHLYQAILNQEEHVEKVTYFTTLAGYIHWRLTGQKVLGIGDASGMFPIDIKTKNYDQRLVTRFDQLVADKHFSWQLSDLLPKVLVAGDQAGKLTEEGAKLLDPSGTLKAGIPLCPPEGDAGTGMTATNSVSEKTGNVSAGTSAFAMIVLEHPLKEVYPEIDMVTTPSGSLVGMVHTNNCTSDINAWVNLFREFAELTGLEISSDELFAKLFQQALKGDDDCGGLLSYGYYSGENITQLAEGRPLFVRSPESN
ncbi:MAG TPA: FGGY family carbohydrate kinase, partial [Tetragenococcus sp.]|nr:FGGY family carbohydrate kinase [Tetragenococcus sp.]